MVTTNVDVESSLLLFRSRGDDPRARLRVAPGGRPAARDADGGLRLADRHITVDESVLRTQNLAMFL